jgi:hypothetical protein
MSKPTLRGRPKAVAADYWQLINSPSTKDDSNRNLPMKVHSPRVASLVLTCTPFLGFAQSEKSKESSPPTPVITTARAYIRDTLEVPAFTPPAPPVEKVVPAMRIDSVVTVPAANSRTLTVIRGEASTLPDIPVPPPPVQRKTPPFPPDQIARLAEQRRHTLQLGATVFDRRLSVVHWQHPDTGESYEAVCGFDISLLSGIGQFVRDGETYSLMLMHSEYDTGHLRNAIAKTDPNLPEVATDAITFTKGNPKDPVGTAPVTLIKDLIASEKSRLTTYQEKRRIYQQDAAAWEKAHPVLPRDETVWLRPHRGSRYLADPQPEARTK